MGKSAWALAVIAGGVVALTSPVMAWAGVEGPDVSGHKAAHGAGRLPATTHVKPTCDDDRVYGKRKCCETCPPGPPRPRALGDGLSSTIALPTVTLFGPQKYIAVVQANGTTLIRDPLTAGAMPWHDISTVSNYPAQVSDVAMSVSPTAPNVLQVTVRTHGGVVKETGCTVTGATAWPANCTPFVDVTPPL
ncbi:hypothetical protein [Sphaerisporangium corydalis]|uniref:Secreted protein n=1 Tax=Sphaerisporangium corydalis TaxID=1441875 RepID=A0ABV9EDK9_9ACTN|nr:hypothetical protein [Sphaerisporangium corydalis]